MREQRLLDRFAAWRDGLQASARFRSWAASFPLTRHIARNRARALFDICAGFTYSQTLAACVELDLFTILAEGPRTPAALAMRVSIPVDATTRLLDAAVSLKLVQRRSGGRYGLGELGCAMIGNEGVAAMVRHHTALYADLRDPVALLRGERPGALSAAWPYSEAGDPTALTSEQTESYTALMAASQAFIAEEVLAAYDFTRHHCLLDIGGGDGSFLSHVAAQAPALQLKLLDLPSVAQQAAARFARSSYASRAQAVGGDAKTGPLPGGADIASFIRVLHDHDDADVLAMLRQAHAALPPGGTLLIAEPMSGTKGSERIGDAYFGFYFLAMGQGRSRTAEALTILATQAGFSGIRELPTRVPMLARVLVASVEAINKT
jgi:demethylspheroidene O-methyltransferase